MPFKRYMGLLAIGETILVFGLLLVGYFFGRWYDAIASGFQFLFIISAIAIGTLILYGISRYARNNVLGK